MPRATTPKPKQREYNAAYEARRKAAGYVRGPRIRSEASERLQVLAFRHRLTPAEVVSRLLLGEPLPFDPGAEVPLCPYERAVARDMDALARRNGRFA